MENMTGFEKSRLSPEMAEELRSSVNRIIGFADENSEKHAKIRAEANALLELIVMICPEDTAGSTHVQHELLFTAPDARILVVDDVRMNLKVIRNFLTGSRITVDTAESGSQCIDMVLSNNYDVIFMDGVMADMDGTEAFRRLADMESFGMVIPPVIMLTANTKAGADEQYVNFGFADYLTKPISSTSLYEALMKFLPADKIIYGGGTDAETPAGPPDLDIIGSMIKGIETDIGYAYCCDNIDFYHDMLKEYCTADRLSALNTAFTDKDWDTYRIQVHSLKSTSLTIGISDLSELAKALEIAAKKADTDLIIANHAVMINRYKEVLDDIKGYFSAG